MTANTPLDRIYRFLILPDTIAAVAAWILAWVARHGLDRVMARPVSPLERHLALLPILIPLIVAANASRGLYHRPPALGRLKEFQQILQAAALGLMAAMTLSFIFKELDIARIVVFLAAALNLFFMTVERNLMRRWIAARTHAGQPLMRTAVIGDGSIAERIAERLIAARSSGREFAGFIGSRSNGEKASDHGLGELEDLQSIVRDHGIHEVFVAVPDMPHERLLDMISACKGSRVTFKAAADLFEVVALHGSIDEIAGVPVIELGPGTLSSGESLAKRTMDLTLAVVIGLITVPLSMLVSLLIQIDSRGSVLFRQERIGRDGKRFTMLKFRTMHADVEPFERSPRDDTDPRITRIGRWLRRTSLDELPQILNVVTGDMSFVGPRPEMPFIVDQYQGWQMQRLNVRPGITGLWQILGRKDLPLEENLEYDFYYIRNQSILLDISILLKTIPTVLLGKGAY